MFWSNLKEGFIQSIKMALVVHYLCSSSTIPLARAVRSRALTIKSSIVKTPDSHVLLGMSEPDLQQLALNFGQVCIQ